MRHALFALLGNFILLYTMHSPPTYQNDSPYLAVALSSISGQTVFTRAQVDTGSDALTIPAAMAESLSLPHDGTTQMTGFGGATETDYISSVNVFVYGHTFTSIPCIISPDMTVPILGIDALRDMGIKSLYINLRVNEIALGFGKGGK